MGNIYYLSHGGPGSGRYPLGSGERPYQKLEGSGRKPSGIFRYIKTKRAEKRESEEIRKNQKRERLLADKERVLKSGKASEVSRYKGELTKQELQDVYKRLNLERMIDEMSSTEVIDNAKVINSVLANVKKTTEWVVAGAASYNTLASVYNSMVDDSKKLPVLKLSR